MKVSSRREVIRTLLGTKPFISLEELEEAFPEVSSMTLRRDIEYFEKQGEAIKVRGGARSMKFITTSMEDAFSKRLQENVISKERLASVAVSMIETGRSIFLDSGTTMLALAARLPDERFTVTTTGPNVALEIIKKRRPMVNIVGGMLNSDNISDRTSVLENTLRAETNALRSDINNRATRAELDYERVNRIADDDALRDNIIAEHNGTVQALDEIREHVGM